MTADEIRDKRQIFSKREWLSEIAAQLTELNATLRAIHPELNLPENCRERKCTYYTDYLSRGPAELTHDGFHYAEEQAENHMRSCTRMERTGACSLCSDYELRLRV